MSVDPLVRAFQDEANRYRKALQDIADGRVRGELIETTVKRYWIASEQARDALEKPRPGGWPVVPGGSWS